MNIIINTYQMSPIMGLSKEVTVGVTEVNGVMRRYFINNGVMNGKGEVFTYALYYENMKTKSVTNAGRNYINLDTALTDSAVYVSEL